MCSQFFRPSATGRIEFSAKLVLSSNSGYSKKRVSFFQSVSAYCYRLASSTTRWQVWYPDPTSFATAVLVDFASGLELPGPVAGTSSSTHKSKTSRSWLRRFAQFD
jgi:hypothetical protein